MAIDMRCPEVPDPSWGAVRSPILASIYACWLFVQMAWFALGLGLSQAKRCLSPDRALKQWANNWTTKIRQQFLVKHAQPSIDQGGTGKRVEEQGQEEPSQRDTQGFPPLPTQITTLSPSLSLSHFLFVTHKWRVDDVDDHHEDQLETSDAQSEGSLKKPACHDARVQAKVRVWGRVSYGYRAGIVAGSLLCLLARDCSFFLSSFRIWVFVFFLFFSFLFLSWVWGTSEGCTYIQWVHLCHTLGLFVCVQWAMIKLIMPGR